MWLLDSSFIREETVINFIVHKNDICEDIMPDKGPVNDRTIICPACHRTDTRAHHFPLVHIGGKKSKASFTYEKQWLIKT